jgi:uncharacterized repeat protein (TIGR03803 family)
MHFSTMRLRWPLLTAMVATMPAHAASFAIIGSVPGGPQIGAIQGGTLIGTIPYEGAGVLFTLTKSGTYAVLHNFNASTDGSSPLARLAVDGAGDIYGTASSGGASGGGTLWEYSATGVMTTPHAFGANGDGSTPMQGPSMGPHRTVYGATGEGAIGNSGNIFSVSHHGNYTDLYKFMSQGDGHCPFSGVAVNKAGTLYGTTVGVGNGGNPNGSVWQFTQAGGLQTLYVFKDGADGEWPTQAPVLDPAGNLYGTTSTKNGANFAGIIWKFSASGKFSILHSMNGATDGSGPNSPLLLGKNGLLYGTTGSGGAANDGTVFSISEAGAFSLVHSFSNTGDGAQPTGNLVRDGAGVIYGGTNAGSVFAINPG